jgi:hypothetical protein
MQISLNVTGLDAVRNAMQQSAKQATYAASQALNATAFELNRQIKADMQATFKGGATAYAQRAFAVDKATKANLTAVVRLRTDAPAGGTPYSQALAHLFTGGTREWKRLEAYLRARKLMPGGLMVVPGPGVRLDARGNIPRRVLAEMLGVVTAPYTNLRVYRRTGAGKAPKGVGYFVAMPGSKATKLAPGIYKRTETGSGSAIVPMVLYVRPGNWRKFINLQALGEQVTDRTFAVSFTKAFEAAMRTAK